MDEKTMQSLMLENKEILNVTGVEGVDNFNEDVYKRQGGKHFPRQILYRYR